MPQRSPLIHPREISEATLSMVFDRAAFTRGMEYMLQRLVLSIDVDPDNVIHGVVSGSLSKPYTQTIRVQRNGHRFAVDGRCTCPVGWNCKHVAAVLLTIVDTNKPLLPEAEEVTRAQTPRAEPEVVKWLKSVEQAVSDDEPPLDPELRLFYVLSDSTGGGSARLVLDLVASKRLKNGVIGKGNRIARASFKGGLPRFASRDDARLVDLIERSFSLDRWDQFLFKVDGPHVGAVLPQVLGSGRCRWEQAGGLELREGPSQVGQFVWVDRPSGAQKLEIQVERGRLLHCTPPWYIDDETGECGPVETDMPVPALQAILSSPEVSPESTLNARETLERLFPERPELLPRVRKAPLYRDVVPVPRFHIGREECTYEAWGSHYRLDTLKRVLPVARLDFVYGPKVLSVDDSQSEIRILEDDQTVIMPRNWGAEIGCTDWLADFRWVLKEDAVGWHTPKGGGYDFLMPSHPTADLPYLIAQRYYAFLQWVPELRNKGWEVSVDEGLEVATLSDSDWQFEARPQGTDWFDLELGIVVNGEKVPLLPILAQALTALMYAGRGLNLHQLPDEGELFHEIPGGKVVGLPIGRIRPLVDALIELLGPIHTWEKEAKVSAARALDLAALDEAASSGGLNLKAPERMRELWSRLESFEEIASVAAPTGLQGELRPYQARGLAWLQFLREYGFSGILADDMGLGKTIQTLSHLLVEKEAGRLDRPALIIAPTSTLPNWRQEAERFAPSLRILVSHGNERAARLGQLSEYDLIVTSYALLSRDKAFLEKQEFHIVVLDEAQNIKNPSTAAAKTACALNARHRICLTGTPVENHLDELWSLFHFLMPGFLGGLTQFRKSFRTPIESHGDKEAQRRLNRMTKPFVLRRTKEQVASELPEKTEIVEPIELAGAQRDLYESLRLAMDKRVRDLIEGQGFEKSRIQILDALLKLRQACCDPRLVKLDTAKEVKASAKLERLLEMLAEFRDSGRRVLIFSQFTSMLDLIEESLRANGYDWVRISGETKDRETPVRDFQSGKVPIFLISLKAGGTGLNLTAADTVIHYDPWWNPAVERQATDRVHRIGQQNAVFVFKLVAEGTVEEKILELQNRKAQIASAALGEETDPLTSLTADDLKWIFEQ